MNFSNLLYKKLSDQAIDPTRNGEGSAGWDLYSIETKKLQPLERHLFKTDIAVQIPVGVYARIADRSGLALNFGLHVLGGVVDSNYRGNVGVILINLNNLEVVIFPKDRIAQMIFETYDASNMKLVKDLTETDRQANGFGSSGR